MSMPERAVCCYDLHELGTSLYLQVWVAFHNHGTVQQEAQVVNMIEAEDGRKEAYICLTHIITQQKPACTVHSAVHAVWYVIIWCGAACMYHAMHQKQMLH